MKPTHVSAVILTFCLLASTAHAQQTPTAPEQPTINPYRPTVTDPATLTSPGYLEIEIGGADQHGGDQTHRAFTTPLVLKLTDKSERLEYHVFFTGYEHQTNPDGSRQSGYGDVTPGLQYLILKHTEHAPDFAARIEYKVPTASRGLGTGKSDYDLLLLASQDLNNTLHADANIGVYQLGRMDGHGFATQYQLSGALNTKLSPTFTLEDELYGYSGTSEGGTIVSTLHAIGYQPSRVVAFDAGIDIGLSHAAPHYTVLFGSTFFAGKLF